MLIVGCGDIGLRVARSMRARVALRALSSSPQRFDTLREAGVTPLRGDLDEPATLRRLAGIATHVIHLAPPASTQSGAWWRDLRTQALVRALGSRTAPAALVYASTSGVYGDCAGEFVSESRPVSPRTPRAQRRVDAERLARYFGRSFGTRVPILRVPGIYAPDRAGGPRDRLLQGTPVLRPEDDVYTNHIHADDLATAVQLALWRGAGQRIYNVSDDTKLKVGDYYSAVAERYKMPAPRRVSRADAAHELSLNSLGFLEESRRLLNRRMKTELRVVLRFPTVLQGLG